MSKEKQLQLLSRHEGIRMLAYLGLFLLAVVYIFGRGFVPLMPGGEPDPHRVGLPGAPPTGVDPQVAMTTLEKYEQEQRGEVVPVASTQLVLDPSVFEGIDDAELEIVEEPAFYHLCALVRGMSDEELATAHERYGSFTWEQLHKPDGSGMRSARGKFITLKGRFYVRPWQRVLAKYPNEAGLAWVWQGLFRQQNRGFFVTITDKDFEPEAGPSGTPIELTGVFVRVYRYQPVSDEDNRPIKSLPHIVVKRMKKLDAKPIDPLDNYPRVISRSFVVLAGLAVVGFGAYTWFSRRSLAEVQTWRRGALRRRLEKSLVQASQAPAPASEGATPAAATGPPVEAAAPVAAAPALVATAPVTAAPATTCPTCSLGCEGAECVVCAACLRRHHRACWADRCGACGGKDGLVPLQPASPTPPSAPLESSAPPTTPQP